MKTSTEHGDCVVKPAIESKIVEGVDNVPGADVVAGVFELVQESCAA